MGEQDKSQIKHSDGVSFREHLIQRLQPCVKEVVLIARPGQTLPPSHCRSVQDIRKDAGPLAGLAAALATKTAPWCFLVACDLPLLDTEIILHLWAARTADSQLVIPKSRRGIEPACALYSIQLQRKILARINQGRRSLQGLLEDTPHTILKLPPHLESSLLNINAPEDLQQFRTLQKQKQENGKPRPSQT